MHEAIHGIAFQMDMRLGETNVTLLGFGITQMLLDNPEFLEVLLAQARKRKP